MRQSVILLMAGQGKRMNLGYNKLMYKLNNKRLFEYALDTFMSFDLDIILVVSKEDYEEVIKIVPNSVKVVIGGASRNESVLNGLKEVKTDRVLIHDAARALVSKDIISRCINSNSRLYYVCNPLKDTIREKDSNRTLNRSNLVSVQTPQGGDLSLFLEYEKFSTTDDISSFDNTNFEIEQILGDDYNFKITNEFDLKLFESIINKRG